MAYVDFFQALSSPLKMEIVSALRSNEMNVTELSEQLGEERSTVSHALRPLLERGFITVRVEGRERIYKTNSDTIVPLLGIIDRHMHTYCRVCSRGTTTMIDNKMTVAQIVAQDYRTAPVFKKFGMDFCCGGKKPLAEACEEKDVDETALQRELAEATTTKAKPLDYSSWDLAFLADYVTNTHHGYIRQAIPQLRPFMEKVVRVHAGKHPELIEIQRTFEELSGELLAHIKEEEVKIFPMIKSIAQQRAASNFNELLKGLESEHESAGASLKRIRELTNDYTPPEGACNTYRVTYSLLAELEEDMHLHVHLENNILFPKATAMLKG